MVYLRGMLWMLALAAAMPLVAAEPLLTPQQGLVLLRNGQVIEGGITRAGDWYVVTLGKTGEIRLPAADVETVCVDLADAYHYRSALIVANSALPHLELAEWCLRNRLASQAAEQLAAAKAKEPSHPQIADVERKLKLALEAPKTEPARRPESAATVSGEQLDKTIRELPPGTLEKFAGVVQPILLNRCGAGGCHGPTARSEFRLLRPPAGQAPSKRFTQRNLYAVLAFLDKENPEESKLLTLPQRRHGTTLAAVFDKRTNHQLQELVAWTRHALEAPSPAPPATIAQAQALLSQPDVSEKPAAMSAEDRSPETRDDSPQPFTPPKDARPRSGDATAPRDPFDPEIFNRKYRGKK